VAPFVRTGTIVEQSHCGGPSTEKITCPIRKAIMSWFGTGPKIKDIWILAPSNYTLSTGGIDARWWGSRSTGPEIGFQVVRRSAGVYTRMGWNLGGTRMQFGFGHGGLEVHTGADLLQQSDPHAHPAVETHLLVRRVEDPKMLSFML